MFDALTTTATLLGCGLAASTTVSVRQAVAYRALRRRVQPLEASYAQAQQTIAALNSESRHLATVRLSAAMDVAARRYAGATVPGLSNSSLQGTPLDHYHQAVLKLLFEAVDITRKDIGTTARSAVRDGIDEAQTHLVRCQMKALEEMEKFPEGTAYNQGLMEFDHLVTKAMHHMQRMRIVTGSWPGVQRANCPFSEIVESARGRIDAYQRVKYTYEPGTGEVLVEGRVVEPLTVALAELLANATSYSAGEVLVEVKQTQTGYAIVVNDSGVNMNPYQRDAAAQVLASGELLDVTNMPDTKKLGFSVIGRLMAEYGFHADVSSTSPYGGVSAVLRVEPRLLGGPPTEEEQASDHQQVADGQNAPSQHRSVPAASAQPLPPETSHVPTAGPPALPQRRRRQPKPTGIRPGAPQPSVEEPAEDPDAFATGFTHLTQTIRDTEDEHKESRRD
ncbi:sensor histidine kinase [Streptomyces nanshensis]|uniref:histidine kinase n=1 Tax=Streptomyces nanshensis TaxID=518642 RepID=A0A1E7KZC6_9ACTN|nr:sensor histidine kinase [Streptomyces nanshensis]OEV09280.1 histidine kinase [Streptomyces nanshensis]